MKIYISIDANKRVQSWGSTRGNANDIELAVSETHEVLKNPFVFTYTGGTLQKDLAYQQELIDNQVTPVSDREKISQLENEVAQLWYVLMTGGVV